MQPRRWQTERGQDASLPPISNNTKNMTTEITKQPTSLKGILNSDAMREQFAAALPQHLSPERFVRIAITALTRTPKLQECTQESFFKCLLDLSAMGLEPDGRRAHLIPFENRRAGSVECTLIIDYKGLVELVRRSGDVAKIHADVVCENDTFSHSLGEITAHTFDLRNPRGDVYAAYAQVTLKDGSVQSAIMSKDEIDAIQKRSRSGQSGPWVTDWNEMAKKTAFRRLTKWLTLSPEIATAIQTADEAEFDRGMRNATPTRPRTEGNPFRQIAAPDLVNTASDRDQAMEVLNEGIIEMEISKDTFIARAEKGGWISKGKSLSDRSVDEINVLSINREAIKRGDSK